MYIRKDDMVMVMTGDDKGTVARVLEVLPKKGKIIVEGVNQVYKHLRPSRQNQQGGRLTKEMPINASNVMLLDPQSGEPTRIGFRYLEDGTKERYAKKSGASLGTISPPRDAYINFGDE